MNSIGAHAALFFAFVVAILIIGKTADRGSFEKNAMVEKDRKIILSSATN